MLLTTHRPALFRSAIERKGAGARRQVNGYVIGPFGGSLSLQSLRFFRIAASHSKILS
jgi:hypothetical protein